MEERASRANERTLPARFNPARIKVRRQQGLFVFVLLEPERLSSSSAVAFFISRNAGGGGGEKTIGEERAAPSTCVMCG